MKTLGVVSWIVAMYLMILQLERRLRKVLKHKSAGE